MISLRNATRRAELSLNRAQRFALIAHNECGLSLIAHNASLCGLSPAAHNASR
jgi:hypothetical protein